MSRLKPKLLLIPAVLIILSFTSNAPIQNFMISYASINPDGSIFHIIKYYLRDGNKFRSEYYNSVDQPSKAGAAFRMNYENKIYEAHTVLILLKDKGIVLSIDPAYKDYRRVPLRNEAWSHAIENIFYADSVKMKKIGEMKILNYNCDILENVQNVKDDKWTNVFYIAQDLNVIMKIETLKNDKSVQVTQAIELNKRKPLLSLFEIPKGFSKNKNN